MLFMNHFFPPPNSKKQTLPLSGELNLAKKASSNSPLPSYSDAPGSGSIPGDIFNQVDLTEML